MAEENEVPQSVTGIDLASMVGQQRDTPDNRFNSTVMDAVMSELEEERTTDEKVNA